MAFDQCYGRFVSSSFSLDAVGHRAAVADVFRLRYSLDMMGRAHSFIAANSTINIIYFSAGDVFVCVRIGVGIHCVTSAAGTRI